MENISSKVKAIQYDIQSIEKILDSGNEDEIKALHVKLDGTYQNVIKNWGHSLYGYDLKFGFCYNYLGTDSLIDNLTAMKGKLRGYLFELAPTLESTSGNIPEYSREKVFIVHGHDHQLLGEVELMLYRIGLKPIILKNEANSGRTIIEKIEDLTDVGFGIVLYTGCDEGREKGTENLKDRARQNVIFEHGYLSAKLSRKRVVALNDDGIEIPSDLSGILYVPHSAPDWKTQLTREMSSAGLMFDATKA